MNGLNFKGRKWLGRKNLVEDKVTKVIEGGLKITFHLCKKNVSQVLIHRVNVSVTYFSEMFLVDVILNRSLR